LQLETLSARLFGCPLPDFLRPRSHASETIGAEGQFHFDVPIALPLIGTVVHYKGSLKPVETPERAIYSIAIDTCDIVTH
jgi:hypothetical protein